MQELGHGVRENLASEAEKICVRITPRVRRYLGFLAGFSKKLLGIEPVLDGHLREQHSPLTTSRNQQSVPADFDLLGTDSK